MLICVDRPPRYIYIPLGGSKAPVVSTVVVFTFVALWHDLSFTLLTWGWLVSLVVLPEILAAKVLPPSRVRVPQIPPPALRTDELTSAGDGALRSTASAGGTATSACWEA